MIGLGGVGFVVGLDGRRFHSPCAEMMKMWGCSDVEGFVSSVYFEDLLSVRKIYSSRA